MNNATQDSESYELALDKVTLAMTSLLDRDGILEAVTGGLVRELDAASAALWLPGDQDLSKLAIAAQDGLEALEPSAPKQILETAATAALYCSNEIPTDGSLGPASWLLENGLRAVAALPLTFRGQVLGVLAVYFRRPVLEAHFARLEVFARTAAVAIENARLMAEARDHDRRLRAENTYLRQEVELESDCGEIVGRSSAIREVLEQVDRVAATDASVLIQGETGTGKELIALAIHQRSRRNSKAMVKINCAAISAGLVESELFGHEKGAFTGAVEQRIGRFELADGGTLFLDEVAELPPETQVKLLRVLQEQEFERVGSNKTIRVDVRVIAAGNRDLAAEVESGRFRADLYYRLNVFPLHLPPLRERKEDIPLIAFCMLPRIAQSIRKPIEGIAPEAVERLLAYPWPGNVRELLNVLERAAILSPGLELEIGETLLPTGRSSTATSPSATAARPAGFLGTLEEVERAHILAVLEAHDWVINGADGAAETLGLHPSTLRSRLQKLDLRRP
ncbi:MAG: sigma 54-interacting transcriptional regulator [Deltaproteobacteria bacterium]|nr:sigma 54-interacting transcriptional regulator [Deltaproteobacteria bacterium]